MFLITNLELLISIDYIEKISIPRGLFRRFEIGGDASNRLILRPSLPRCCKFVDFHAKKRGVSAQVQVPMNMSELADAAARELLDQRFVGRSMQSGLFAAGFWCSAMAGNGSQMRKSSSQATAPVCGKLRVMFDVADEPMPDSLASLTDRLDAAFTRGDLSGAKPKG